MPELKALKRIANVLTNYRVKSCLRILNLKYCRYQTPGFALQIIPWDSDLELEESIPRHEVSRAEETAVCNGSRDCRQRIWENDLKFKIQLL